MEKLVSRIACVCCGEYVSKPVFLDGKVYGSHCAKKITGKSQAGKFAICLEIIDYNFVSNIVMFEGKKYYLPKARQVLTKIDFIINTKNNVMKPANSIQALTVAIINRACENRDDKQSINDSLLNYLNSL